MGCVIGLSGVIASVLAGPGGLMPAVARQLADRYSIKVPPYQPLVLKYILGTRIAPLDTPALGRANPNLRLFRTTFNSGELEYPEVETVVAAWMERGVLKTTICPSPVFKDMPAEFAALFRGLKGRTAEERERLAAEVCGLFAAITYKGAIRAGKMTGDEYRAELWHGEQLWRPVRVVFDASGGIREVTLTDSKAREK
jgi:hypothetical protein